MSDVQRQIGIFAKYWQPGKVKTRLAAAVGNEAAADLAKAFVTTLVARLEAITECRRVIGYWPACHLKDFKEIAVNWDAQLQRDGHLGQRMEGYFQKSFEQGATDVLLLGADCPTVPLERINDAFEMLLRHDIVLGPARDGGYYLIGARNAVPPVFEQLEWGSPTVLDQTIALANKHRVTVGQVDAWDDVDDLDDLRRIQAELHSPQYADPIWKPLRDSVTRAFGENQ